jgi:cyanate permease
VNLGGVGKKTHVNDEHLIGSDGRLSTGWRVVIVSVLAMIVGPPSVLILSFGLFLPEFQAAFGWSIQAISVGATLMSLILVVTAPLQGYLVDRLRERPTAVIEHAAGESSLVHGLPFEQAIRSSTFLIIAVGFSVIGVLSAAFLVHQFNILFETGISKRAATLLQSYLGITSIVGQLLVGWLMDRVAAGRIVAEMLALIALACVAYTTSWASARQDWSLRLLPELRWFDRATTLAGVKTDVRNDLSPSIGAQSYCQ